MYKVCLKLAYLFCPQKPSVMLQIRRQRDRRLAKSDQKSPWLRWLKSTEVSDWSLHCYSSFSPSFVFLFQIKLILFWYSAVCWTFSFCTKKKTKKQTNKQNKKQLIATWFYQNKNLEFKSIRSAILNNSSMVQKRILVIVIMQVIFYLGYRYSPSF